MVSADTRLKDITRDIDYSLRERIRLQQRTPQWGYEGEGTWEDGSISREFESLDIHVTNVRRQSRTDQMRGTLGSGT